MFKFIIFAFLFASSTIQGFKVTDPIATAGQVKADVAHIVTSYDKLNTAVDALAVDRPNEILDMQLATVNGISALLSSDLNTATLHLKIVDTLPGDDSRAILSAIEGIEPTINSTMKTLISKKAALSKVPLAVATLRFSLGGLQFSMMRLFEKCIGAFPAALSNDTSACAKRIDNSFQSAVDVYATA